MLRALRLLLLPALLAFIPSSHAQGVEMLFGSVDGGSGPVTVVASEVVFDQENGLAVFDGNVRVSQGDIILISDHAEVHSNKDDASEINLIVLTKGVNLETGQGTASSRSGEYNLVEGIIRLFGDVIIKSGSTEFSAEGLHYDVATGVSRLVSNASVSVEAGN